jgi:DNA-binding transcriptional ArsR family regulator
LKVIFKPGMSEVRNLLDSLYMLYNKNYKKMIESFNLKPNKSVEEAFEFLSERVSFNIKYHELFFKEDIFAALSLVSFEALEKCQTVADYIKALGSLDEEEIKYIVLKELKNDETLKEEYLKDVLRDEKKVIEFIRNLELSSAVKWEVFEFFQEVKASIDELVELLEGYYPLFISVLEKNKTSLQEFDNYLITGIKKDSDAFIKMITRGLIDFEGVEEIYVASIFFNSHSLSFNGRGSKLYLYVGITFEEAADGIFGEEQVEINLNILKNLSDKTRFQTLMLLKDKEMYGQEIADKIGITMATVSYHMSYLLISNLVLIEKVGHKGYYKLNKETLRKNIDFLKGIFEL